MKLIILILILILILFFLRFKKVKPIIYTYYYIKNYNDLLNDSIMYTAGGIPKIIIKTSWHYINHIPIQMKEALEISKNLNPEYQQYYFNDDDVIRFMKDYSEDVFKCYKKLIPGAFKADLFRICILEKYGGCYSDIGHLMKVGFNEICGDCNIVLVNDKNIIINNINVPIYSNYNGIHNALMCTVPNHPFFQKLIEKTCENINNNYYGEDSLDITGPRMIGKVYNCFFADKCNNDPDIKDFGIIDYNCDRCKIKILKFITNPFFFNTKFIYNNNKELIQTKFDNYYDIMYTSKKTPRYGELWKQRKVYN